MLRLLAERNGVRQVLEELRGREYLLEQGDDAPPPLCGLTAYLTHAVFRFFLLGLVLAVVDIVRAHEAWPLEDHDGLAKGAQEAHQKVELLPSLRQLRLRSLGHSCILLVGGDQRQLGDAERTVAVRSIARSREHEVLPPTLRRWRLPFQLGLAFFAFRLLGRFPQGKEVTRISECPAFNEESEGRPGY